MIQMYHRQFSFPIKIYYELFLILNLKFLFLICLGQQTYLNYQNYLNQFFLFYFLQELIVQLLIFCIKESQHTRNKIMNMAQIELKKLTSPKKLQPISPNAINTQEITSNSINNIIIQKSPIMHADEHAQKKEKQWALMKHIENLNQNQNQRKEDLTIYLPGYLRLKMKNFASLELDNLTSGINASLIYTIYYGKMQDYLNSIQYIQKKQDDMQKIIASMKNDFILLFAKDDAIQLSQGKSEKIQNQDVSKDQKGEKDEKNKSQPSVKLKRNLEITFSHDEKNKQLKFTVRKNLHLHLEGEVFLSPFQIIHSLLQVTIQPLDIKIKSTKKSFKIKINLMDHENTDIKLSFGSQRKFGQYGLLLSGLKAKYTNQRINNVEQMELAYSQLKKLNDKKKQQKKQRDRKKRIKYQDRQLKLQQEKSLLERTGYPLVNQSFALIKKQSGQLKEIKNQKKFKHCQYAYFKIPMYKFPFTSIASIFLPLWLLAVINLSIFYQDPNLGQRIGAVASLMVAFAAFIPTIRQQIPPNKRVVFIEVLVYLKAIIGLFALFHSLDIRNQPAQWQFIWQESALFIISCIILGLSVFTITLMMIIHYSYWQRKYKAAIQVIDPKFKRDKWFNNQCEQLNKKQFCLVPVKNEDDSNIDGIYQLRLKTKINNKQGEMPGNQL